MGDRAGYVAASVAMVAATPVAVWWLTGDLSSEGFAPEQLDYIVRPPDLPAVAETSAGVAAVAVVLAAATVLGVALRRGRIRRVWSATVVPLWVAAAVVGFGARLVTAGGIGANIGGAFAVLVGGPFVAVLVIAAAINAWSASRGRADDG